MCPRVCAGGAADGNDTDGADSDDNDNDSDDENEDEDEYIPEAIVGHRGVGKARRYLVRWEGYDEDEDTWEPHANLEGVEVFERYIDRLNA